MSPLSSDVQTVYILGPMTGHADSNFPAFRTAASDLRSRGRTVISPVEMDEADGYTPPKDGSISPERYFDFLRRDFARILAEDPDAGVALPGWQQSNGASGEAALLRSLGKPLFAYPDLHRVGQADEEEVGAAVRTFETGATRDTDEGKLDYEGFLSPLVVQRFAEYMQGHRVQPDGALRSSDNWQLGIPPAAYMKSGWRHFMDWWMLHRGIEPESGVDVEEAVCAVMFNAQGYLHELLKRDF